jgi:DNA-binding transcriptional regulator YdaS (Cro superfamily)
MDHPIDVAAQVVGSQVALAARLGVTKAAVNQWKGGGREVPLQHCAAIEIATGRMVMRWHLRPDDWHRIWPELIGAEGAPPVPTAQAANNSEVRDAA